MTIILMLMALAGIVGFLLSIYLFFFRLHLSKIWRWLGGIVGGLIMGSFMALITFLILWPPMVDFVTAGGVGLMFITILVLMDSSKKAKKEAEEHSMILGNSILLTGSEQTLADKDI